MKIPDKPMIENPVEYKCALCLYSTKILKHYKQHAKVHSSEKPFKCPECPFKSKWKSNVNKHLTEVHLLQSSSSRPFPCSHPGCTYAAKENGNLSRHSKIHSDEKDFVCSHPNCEYSTKRKAHLIRHIRTHTGEKPFVCQFESCSYAAACSKDLVIHTRTHTKERPFKCPQQNCVYSAADNSALKSHQLTHEPKEGQVRSSFKCPLCEYFGKSRGNLLSHIKSHTLEKLFKCDEPNCSFEAKKRQNIENHKHSKHSDKKPFACSIESCEYRCKRKTHLSDHLKSHSEERKYKCELCPYRGKIRSAVTQHLNRMHFFPISDSPL